MTTESDSLMVGWGTPWFLHHSDSTWEPLVWPSPSLYRWGLWDADSLRGFPAVPQWVYWWNLGPWLRLSAPSTLLYYLQVFSDYLKSNTASMGNFQVCICNFVHKLNFVYLDSFWFWNVFPIPFNVFPVTLPWKTKGKCFFLFQKNYFSEQK